MDPWSLLVGLAQIGITLAGFSAIAAVLVRDKDFYSPQRIVQAMGFILGNSLVVVFLALTPFVLSANGVNEPLIWRWAAGVTGLVMVIWRVVRLVLRWKDLGKLRPLLLGSMSGMGILIGLTAVLSSGGYISLQPLSAYFACLVWFLVSGVVQVLLLVGAVART